MLKTDVNFPKRYFSLFVVIPILLCLCPCLSCTGHVRPSDLPVLHPVKITVFQDERPCPDVSVAFIPDSVAVKWIAGGVTDAEGNCELWTQGRYRGIPAGKYKVMAKKQIKEDTALYDVVDPKFGNVATTELAIEIVSERNHFTLNLGPSVKNRFKFPE